MKRDQKAIITTILVVLNAAIFIWIMLMGKTGDTLFLLEHGACFEPLIVEKKEYYRLITSMFLHFDIDHIVNNMVMLGVLGLNLELVIGKFRFVLIYFLSGIVGNIVSLIFHMVEGATAVSAGASGAVFGLMGALLCAAIQQHGYVGRLGKRGLFVMVILSLYIGLTSGGVDNAAHIGGLCVGFLLQAVMGVSHQR